MARRVWVLATDVWSHTMSVPAMKAAGLKEEELAGALNFEAESLSGLAALDASLAFAALPPVVGSRDDQYWIGQLALNDRDTIDELVRRAGFKPAKVSRTIEDDVP